MVYPRLPVTMNNTNELIGNCEREALTGETRVCTGLQLWHSSVTPFIRLSQMLYHKRLIVLPLESFHRLADSVGDPKKLVFLFNCARCGSTLLGQVRIASSKSNHVVGM